MFTQHYPALVTAYLVALAGWIVFRRLLKGVWPAAAEASFASPGIEIGVALAGSAGVLLAGQLYSRGIRLPETGPLGPILSSLNQLLIFLPILAVLPLRRQPWSTAWLSTGKLGQRAIGGIVLAALAVCAYSLAREGAGSPGEILGRLARYRNLDKLVQVALEDLTIAILCVRFISLVGRGWAALAVGALFAMGHVPALLSQGASGNELAHLVLDGALGAALISVIARSRDILWFIPIHFCLDMTQFDWVTFAR